MSDLGLAILKREPSSLSSLSKLLGGSGAFVPGSGTETFYKQFFFSLFLQEELLSRLGKKLVVLSNEQTTISEESTSNDILGTEIAIKVQQKVKPSDASKFRTYVDDVGHITMLLLSLSGRLAKVENSLHCTDSGTEKVCFFGTC